jgi:hypothetical protein
MLDNIEHPMFTTGVPARQCCYLLVYIMSN